VVTLLLSAPQTARSLAVLVDITYQSSFQNSLTARV